MILTTKLFSTSSLCSIPYASPATSGEFSGSAVSHDPHPSSCTSSAHLPQRDIHARVPHELGHSHWLLPHTLASSICRRPAPPSGVVLVVRISVKLFRSFVLVVMSCPPSLKGTIVASANYSLNLLSILHPPFIPHPAFVPFPPLPHPTPFSPARPFHDIRPFVFRRHHYIPRRFRCRTLSITHASSCSSRIEAIY